MVEIVVDAKPRQQAPIDPNTIPPAVRARAAAVDALYSPSGDAPPTAASPVAEPASLAPVPTPPQAVAEPAAPAAPAAAPTEPPAAPPAEDVNWKERALTAEGRLHATRQDLGQLQEDYYREVAQHQRAQRQPKPRREAPPAPKQFLTPKDEEAFGPELLDVAQRAAQQVVAPVVQSLEEQNAELRRRLANQSKVAMDMAIEVAVPNFREIDNDPRWHRWLMGIDLLSGRVRQRLLDEAIAAGSAPRVISFFKSFLNEEAATGHIAATPPAPVARPEPPRAPAVPLASLAAPGKGVPAGGGDSHIQPDKPIYTRPQIASLYEHKRRGAYVGREAEWARLEVDIIAAGREGRIR